MFLPPYSFLCLNYKQFWYFNKYLLKKNINKIGQPSLYICNSLIMCFGFFYKHKMTQF